MAAHQVPALPRFILLHGFARPCLRRQGRLVESAVYGGSHGRYPVTP